MATQEYLEKLKDPRWQKMRLKILERDEFCCQCCYNGKSTLHIHHMYYERGKDPWDYSLDAFVTLCEDCHYKETKFRGRIENNLLNELRKRFLGMEIIEITKAFAFLKSNHPRELIANVIKHIFMKHFEEIYLTYYGEFKTRKKSKK